MYTMCFTTFTNYIVLVISFLNRVVYCCSSPYLFLKNYITMHNIWDFFYVSPIIFEKLKNKNKLDLNCVIFLWWHGVIYQHDRYRSEKKFPP